MPRQDKTGNTRSGRGFGAGRSQGPLGSDVCTCPNCGHEEPHTQRGVPCAQIKCPKCQTPMKGELC